MAAKENNDTITISDGDDSDLEVQYLSPTSVANRFGGEDLCERAFINRLNHWDKESIPLDNYNEEYVKSRIFEGEKNGFSYEPESLLQSVLEDRYDCESDTKSEEEDDDLIEDILGETTDSELKLKWTPKVLMKPSDDYQKNFEQQELIDEFDYKSALDFDKSNSSCLAFNSIPVQPMDTYHNTCCFYSSFKERLKRLECKDVTLELYLWPSIAKKISVACISGPKTGKTTGYLVPLMNLFDTDEGQENRDQSKIGAIIICSSTRQTYLIQQLAKLWRDPKTPQMEHKVRILGLNTTNESKQMTAILNGCDILVSTPEPLLRGIKSSIIDFTHTQAFIVDEADITLSLHKKTVFDIYLSYAAMKKSIKPYVQSNGVTFNPMAFQTMVFAERWTPDVEWFIKEVQHMPNIIFGSHYEVSITLKTICEVNVIDSEDNRESSVRAIVGQILKSKEVKHRIGIVCRGEDEMKYLLRQIKPVLNGTLPILITHKTPHYDVQRYSQHWNKVGGILFINEEAIKIVEGFQSCRHLIHYKLPKNFENSFGERFRLMRRVMKSYKKPMDVDKDGRKLNTFIVLSPQENNVSNVIEYLTRLKQQIPKRIQCFEERPLCSRFAAYGNCPFEAHFCLGRHEFIESDKPSPHLPTNGQIKIVISYIKGTNEFYFRLNAFRNECHTSGQWQTVSPNLDEIQEELNEFRDHDLNTVKKLSLNAIYGISIRGQVLRVRLTEIKTAEALKSYEKYDPKDMTQKVELFAVDYGHTITSQARQLFELPEHLKTLPAFAHEAYLFGIRPLDNEIDWDSRSTQRFYEFIDNYRLVDITAWVLKQVNGLFWLNRLHVTKRLSNIRDRLDSDPIKDLIGKYVALNEYKLPTANTDFDRIVNIWHNHRLTTSAYHSCLVDDSTYVVVSDFVSTDHFYVIQEDRVTRLQRLEDKWSSDLESLEPLKEITVDQICFYKYVDIQYGDISLNRAKVTAINSEKVDVFLVDHGEFIKNVQKSCLYRIRECDLKELPFQAIRVSLHGVRPLKPITYEFICDLTRDENDKYKMCIADKVSYADGVHKIRLYVADNTYESHYTCLSKLLVDSGCAEYTDGEEDNELTLTVNKESVDQSEEDFGDYGDYIEKLENEMAGNLFWNQIFRQIGLTPEDIKEIKSDETTVGPRAQVNTNSIEAEPTAATSQSMSESKPQINGYTNDSSEPESRVSKTKRRLQLIQAKKLLETLEEKEESGDEEEAPKRLSQVDYVPGEFDYTPAWTTPMFYDPNDHLDDNCDYSDEEGVLEEEELS